MDPVVTIATNVERLITVEMRRPGMAGGYVASLAEGAREHAGEVPALAAARRLKERVARGDHVFITTGAGGAPWLPAGETDGPPGAAALAYILHELLGACPVLIGEPEMLPPVVASAEALGLSVLEAAVLKQRPHTASSEPFARDLDDPHARAVRLLEQYDPSAVIAVEKLGPNRKGVIHSASGKDLTRGHASVHRLFEEARQRQILTIGIGDNGNEIGFGSIAAVIEKVNPYGRQCQCPCGGGITDSTETDLVVAANVSNWGAYAVEICLAVLCDAPEAIHDGSAEVRVLEACVRAGACDGVLLRRLPWVDGASEKVQEALVTLLRATAHIGLKATARLF